MVTQHLGGGLSHSDTLLAAAPPVSPESCVGRAVVAGGPGLAQQSAHSPRGQVPPALFWPHFGLRAVEPPAGWLPRLFQSENTLALTLTPGLPPGTEHSVFCLEAPGGGKGRPNPGAGVLAARPLPTPSPLQFQGEWFVLGLAGNTHTVADRSLLSPFTATFTLNKNNHFEVAYAMFRGQRCITWSYELISQSQPGVFSVDHRGGEGPGADPEEIHVYDTDYASFALLLSRKQSDLRWILRVSLLCRIWAIQTQLLDKFVCLVRAQGLSDDNIIFPDLT
ncbi:epididymal-specific lipocalin-12-like, partial [Oryx dammah]|uniref:epididymal-specific lipocalin-12-like n=1 Tax=Oryx dammah TaxID=59534 RepID=UPI001A9C01C0